jgi:hypothetical protein
MAVLKRIECCDVDTYAIEITELGSCSIKDEEITKDYWNFIEFRVDIHCETRDEASDRPEEQQRLLVILMSGRTPISNITVDSGVYQCQITNPKEFTLLFHVLALSVVAVSVGIHNFSETL